MVSPIKNRYQILSANDKNTNTRKALNIAISMVVTTVFVSATAHALQPITDISPTPLELTPTVEPNVMILLDDSGSMDFEIMTADAISSGLFFGPDADGSQFGSTAPGQQITHRTDCELEAAAFGGYAYGVAADTNHYSSPVITPAANSGANSGKCYVADARAWRFRCSSFNTLYYDPMVDYKPWMGFRDDGTAFPAASVTAAPLNPYLANSDTINLEAPDPSTGIDQFRVYACDRSGANGSFRNISGELPGGDEIEGLPIVDMQNFANWFSYHRSRHLRAKAILGEYIFNQSGTRIGLTRFNFFSSPSLEAEEMNDSAEDVDGAKRMLLDALYSTSPQQLSSIINDDESSPLDDRYIETANYLMDGDSDLFSGNPDSPAEAAPAGTCQANHIIVASDGFYDRITGIGNNDEEGSGPAVTLQLLHGPFDGGDFDDNFANTFADVAILFYENDLQPTLANEVVPTSEEVNQLDLDDDERLHQHIKTHIVTIQASLGDDVAATPPWVNNPRLSDLGLLQDLVHAAFNARGRYIDVAEQDVSTSVQTISQAITTGLGSTTPIAINTQATSANIVLYRTFYDSFSNSGDLVAQGINFDGTPDAGIIWSAAKQLDELITVPGTNHSQRTIFTYADSSDDGINFIFDDLDPSQQAQLNQPMPGTLILGEDRLEYLRGDSAREGTSFDNGEFRIRPETDSTGGGIIHNAKLGTIANAAPVFVGLPQAVGRFGGLWPNTTGDTYFEFQADQATRDASVLAAANDGMFHVFNAETGAERFAYVPSLVFDNLSALTLPEYKHQFFVDSTPSVEDAFIRPSSSASSSWNTIVIGGLGAGGRGYYALNITDADPAGTAAEQVMWEFGPEDDPQAVGSSSDLGLSFGRPLIAMSNAVDGVNQKWVAVFGNGYNSTSPDGEAIIYMLFIDQGIDGDWSPSDLVKINTGVGGVGTPNGIADVRGVDLDANGTIDRLYAGDLRGNLHVVDIRSANSNDWDSSSNRFILFEAEYSQNGATQPITTRPIVADNGSGPGLVVIFTTGSYFTRSDAIDTDIQSIYGIVDETAVASGVGVGSIVDADDLVEQTLTNQSFTNADTSETIDVRVVSNLQGNDDGWFIDFDVQNAGGGGIEFPGEKAVRALQLRNDVLFVNTIIPQELSCDPAPGGFSLALDPQTGSSGQEVIFDINNDGDFDAEDNINVSSGTSGVIVGTRFESTPTDSTFFGDYRITQLSDTSIDSIRTNTAKTELVGRQAWREVEF